MAALVLYKRPAIGAYLRNDHDYIGWALNELAKEWASIEYRNGRGYYDHIGGNRAHISRTEVSWEVLQGIKRTWQSDGVPAMINSYPGIPTMKKLPSGLRAQPGKERKYWTYLPSLSLCATLSATELIGPNATLVRVYENPDW